MHEAVFPQGDAMTLPRSDSLADDVREMLRRTAAAFSAPPARAALPGLLAEIAADRSLHAVLLERFAGEIWGVLPERLADAAARGEVRPGLDPASLIEVIGGTVLMALLMRETDHLDDDWIDRTADLLTRGITP